MPVISRKRRRRGLLSLQSPETDEEAEEDVREDGNKDDEEEDEEDDFLPSEGSENEMETEILDYI